MNILEGKLIAEGLKIGIVVGRFNEFIGSKLLGGCVDGLVRHGVKDEDIDVAWVPGAFEIPVITKKMAQSQKYDAIICLGAVIRGATTHYDYVCAESVSNVGDLGSIPGIRRSPGGGYGNPLQYSCLENLHGERSLVESQRVRYN